MTIQIREGEVSEVFGAIVSSDEFRKNQECPICTDTSSGFDLVEPIEIESILQEDDILGSIFSCRGCGCFIISITFPIIDLKEPVHLDWSIIKKTTEKKGNSNEADGISVSVSDETNS